MGYIILNTSGLLQESLWMISVLIIEDDTSTRLVTKLHLKNEYQILEAANGLEALDILEQQHVDLHSVLMLI